MKIFLLPFLIIFQNSYAQVENFVVFNKKITWENVYISNEANIPQLIERHSNLRIISQKGNLYKGVAKTVRCNCPEVSSTLDSSLNFNFEIELRGDKYRVTLTDFIFLNKTKALRGDTIYVENGTLKSDSATQNDLSCLNDYFNRIFSMTVYYRNKS